VAGKESKAVARSEFSMCDSRTQAEAANAGFRTFECRECCRSFTVDWPMFVGADVAHQRRQEARDWSGRKAQEREGARNTRGG